MQLLLAPAKKMIVDNDDFVPTALPKYLKQTEILKKQMEAMSYVELKEMWICNDAIAKENHQRLQHMNLQEGLSPALFSYVGLAYQHISPGALSQQALDYLQEHLYILSGFYGILRPFDGITPYRLEMQAKMPVIGDLYHFWKDLLYQEVIRHKEPILNLASKEYAKCIEDYICEKDCYITISFMEEVKGKLVQKGTMAKMARGEMVQWIAENQCHNPEELKAFSWYYQFSNIVSTQTEYIFIKK